MSPFRFSLRALLLAFPVVAVATFLTMQWIDAQNVFDLTIGEKSTCEIHDHKMSKGLVAMQFGMRFDAPIDEARPKLFPHADEPYDTRACMAMPQEKARVYICPLCTKSRAAWLVANETP